MSETALLISIGIATVFAALLVIADHITQPDPESESWEQKSAATTCATKGEIAQGELA